eukprot:g11913.t1
MARSLRLLLVLLFGRFCEGFYCRVLEDVARNLPRGWRQALRQFNALLCPADGIRNPALPRGFQEPKRPELSEEYLQHLEHPALFFRVDFTKKDASEKVGLDLSLRKDYLEVDKVIPDGPAARWSAQKPLKAGSEYTIKV